MPHLLKQKKKSQKRKVYSSRKVLPPISKKVRYVTGSEGSELKDYKLRGMTVSEEPKCKECDTLSLSDNERLLIDTIYFICMIVTRDV